MRNCDEFSSYYDKLLSLVDGDPRIEIINETLSPIEIESLIRNSDVFISLHRAEGFGLHLAEAMRAGTITIATGWSGNLEFMNKYNSYLISYNLIQVYDTESIYTINAANVWADASVSNAADILNKIQSNESQSGHLIKQAQQDIKNNLNALVYKQALNGAT